MGTTALVSVEEYLKTSYPDGDRDYLDGLVVERNVGESLHARIQTAIATWLFFHYPQFWSAVEVRVRIRPSRYRVPDITLVAGPRPKRGPIMDPPFLVVEVLSPDDRPGEMQKKIADYRACGVSYIWIVDPIAGSGEIYTPTGNYTSSNGMLRTEDPEITVPFGAMIQAEQEDES
jgi:Uma2 family endonuclease